MSHVCQVWLEGKRTSMRAAIDYHQLKNIFLEGGSFCDIYVAEHQFVVEMLIIRCF